MKIEILMRQQDYLLPGPGPLVQDKPGFIAGIADLRGSKPADINNPDSIYENIISK